MIGGGVFKNCKNLEVFNAPKRVNTIHADAFKGCKSLKTVNYEGSASTKAKIKIESGNKAFKNAQWNFKHAHKWKTTKTVKPTYAKSGYTTYKCSQCNHTKKVIKAKLKVSKAKIKSAKVGKKSMTVKMAKKASSYKANKFQIQYKVKGAKKWTTKTVSSQSAKITKLKKGKKYQVRVRAVKSYYGKTYYGAWSGTLTTGKVR